MKLGAVLLFLTLFLGPQPVVGELKPLSDEELDWITPAGQPDGLPSSGHGTPSFTFTDHQQATLTLGETSQALLRAVMLNNVVGSNLVANALNVAH